MYNLLAERDKDGDECPECEPGTMLNTVHVTDRRVWDFMKAEEGEKDWFFTEDDPSTVINWGEFTINPASQTPEGITHDYSFLDLFFGVEDLALKGAAKFAVVPFIVKGVKWGKPAGKLTIAGGKLTKSQLRSISSLKNQILKHETKLAEYIKDPMKFDNKGFLKNAPNDAIRQKIIDSRISHLQQEIKTFQDNIQKIINPK